MESFDGTLSCISLNESGLQQNCGAHVSSQSELISSNNGGSRRRQWRARLEDAGDPVEEARTNLSMITYVPKEKQECSVRKKSVKPIRKAQAKPKGKRKAKGGRSNPIFTVQCDTCLKWRVVPTEGEYERIRARFSARPFVCQMAARWGHIITCRDPADITVEESNKMWVVDRPNIPSPPPGWKRLVTLRENSMKFADVYYISPCGFKFRSRVEIQKFLDQNPHYTEQQIRISEFDFSTPVESVYDSSKFNGRMFD